MFGCRNCTRNFARAFLSASLEGYAESVRLTKVQRSIFGLRNAEYATATARTPKQRSVEEQARIDAGLPPDVQTFEEAGISALKENAAIKRFKREKTESLAIKEAVSVLDGKTPLDVTTLRRHAKLELQYIDEPFRLADRSLLLVKNGEIDQALELVRMAGKRGMECTVGWNHILNTLSQSGRLDTAWKLFNEMKKLGQKPDSYTITLLLRGYATEAKTRSVSLPTALSIYDSTHAPKSSVKPQIIHANALLDACAQAGNLEMMFNVAAKLPQRGPCAPDEITYTIIFNALANANAQDKPGEHIKRQRLISHARSIWPDVLSQWKTGRLVMTEKLVCSMGRVLMTSHLQSERDDVFSLVQQTMRIPRQSVELPKVHLLGSQDDKNVAAGVFPNSDPSDVARLSSNAADSISKPEVDLNTLFDDIEARPAAASPSEAQDAVRWSPHSAVAESTEVVSSAESDGAVSHLANEQRSKKSHKNSGFGTMQASGLVFAKPGNNTLSLLVKACASIKQYKAATKYWEILQPMFTPDTVNYIDYMKLLKDCRASSRATDTLRDIYKLSISSKRSVELLPVFFWHALSACVRAKDTKTALQDGTRVLAMLQMVAAEPQPRLMGLFTSLLSRNTADFPVKDVELAIESLMITFGNLKSFYAFGRTQGNGPPVPSASLTELIHEIEPKWQPVRKRYTSDLGRSREDILMEARTRLTPATRTAMRDLGRNIETAVGRVLKLYAHSLDQNQLAKIRADLYRIRAWFLPREKTWLTKATNPTDEAKAIKLV